MPENPAELARDVFGYAADMALKAPAKSYSIAEWFGHPLALVDAKTANKMQAGRNEPSKFPCPFANFAGAVCNKKGGVCSLREYRNDPHTLASSPTDAPIRATCPRRFDQADVVERWIATVMFGAETKVARVQEVGFLRAVDTGQGNAQIADVGKIDQILVVKDSDPLRWCAVEKQAVYFSGSAMDHEFKALAGTDPSNALPPVHGRRHPDDRSSGPKRLMPQLQIKVPTLRRWGKRLAVVVDRGFFDAMAPMPQATNLTLCDIVWFVADLKQADNGAITLTPGKVVLTTLENAVEGLTAGTPCPLHDFEEQIRHKLAR
jgi:hypothetical protein